MLNLCTQLEKSIIYIISKFQGHILLSFYEIER